MSVSLWRKNSIRIVLLFVLGGSLIVGGLVPQIKNASACTKTIKRLESELNNQKERLTLLKKTANDPKTLQETYATTESLWPNKEDVSQFIIQTERLANDNELAISNVSITKPVATTKKNSDDGEPKTTVKTNKTMTGTKFSFDTKTSYQSAFSFIVGMERLARLNSIESLHLTADKEGNVTVKLSGQIYGP